MVFDLVSRLTRDTHFPTTAIALIFNHAGGLFFALACVNLLVWVCTQLSKDFFEFADKHFTAGRGSHLAFKTNQDSHVAEWFLVTILTVVDCVNEFVDKSTHNLDRVVFGR